MEERSAWLPSGNFGFSGCSQGACPKGARAFAGFGGILNVDIDGMGARTTFYLPREYFV